MIRRSNSVCVASSDAWADTTSALACVSRASAAMAANFRRSDSSRLIALTSVISWAFFPLVFRIGSRRLLHQYIGLGGFQRRPPNFQLRILIARVDPKQHIAGFDMIPDPVIELGDHARDRRAKIDVLGAGLDDARAGNISVVRCLRRISHRQRGRHRAIARMHKHHRENQTGYGDEGKDITRKHKFP